MTYGTQIKQVEATAILPLRCRILRPGQPIESAVFEGDSDTTTYHLAIIIDDLAIATLSLMQRPMPDCNNDYDKSYQLRGMAVDHCYQSQGLGGKLLNAAQRLMTDLENDVIWMNARSSATAFYENHGYRITGGEFDIPGVGPHYVMFKKL
ncbi:MAG: GNAT family N-acetyltransferase [Nonlabens sp.]